MSIKILLKLITMILSKKCHNCAINYEISSKTSRQEHKLYPFHYESPTCNITKVSHKYEVHIAIEDP